MYQRLEFPYLTKAPRVQIKSIVAFSITSRHIIANFMYHYSENALISFQHYKNCYLIILIFFKLEVNFQSNRSNLTPSCTIVYSSVIKPHKIDKQFPKKVHRSWIFPRHASSFLEYCITQIYRFPNLFPHFQQNFVLASVSWLFFFPNLILNLKLLQASNSTPLMKSITRVKQWTYLCKFSLPFFPSFFPCQS